MERTDLYRDIAERTQGDIYLGVVGPVRTGKSTFIRRFMDLMVLPGLENEHERRRVTDELPQSGAGKTIMTTQPRFVPNEAAQLKLGENLANVRVRLVDCVGYMVDGALGFSEGETPRMVRTPWSDEQMPFEKAAEIGTHKVISEHSTIGVVMTTDGTITDLPRSAYIAPEERVVRELRELGRPFVVVLNSRDPEGEEAQKLRDALAQKYDVPVLALDVLNMTAEDVSDLLENLLFEFPLRMVHFSVPGWVQALPEEHWLTQELLGAITKRLGTFSKVRDYGALLDAFDECEHLESPQIVSIDLGKGQVEYEIEPVEGLFYEVLGEACGCAIESDYHLMAMLKELVEAKREYDRVKSALEEVRTTGYSMIAPTMSELKLDEPEMIQRGAQYGVRLRASGPSLHLIRADVACEVSPLVGTEQQSEELVKYLLSEFESDPQKIWETNLFGKSLHDLVSEGLSGKLTRMPEDARDKLQETVTRIINEGGGGLICILL